MPIMDSVGYGELTPLKIEHLSRIIAMHTAITKAVLNKNSVYTKQYRYVDLTAGKGSTPDDTKGSPVVFLEEAESPRFGIPYRADFIECEKKNLDQLQAIVRRESTKNSWGCHDVHFHHGDYQKVVNDLFPETNRNMFGLVFVDPSGDLPDIETLRLVAKRRPKMEILMYISATNIKKAVSIHGQTSFRFYDRNWEGTLVDSQTYSLGHTSVDFSTRKQFQTFYRLQKD